MAASTSGTITSYRSRTGEGGSSAQRGRQTASPRSNAASNARCHRAPASASTGRAFATGTRRVPCLRTRRAFFAQFTIRSRPGSSAALRNLNPSSPVPSSAISSRASAGLMFPAAAAKPFRERTELRDYLAASGRRGEVLRGRQAHRKLGEFPLLTRSGPAELALEHTPQQILIEHHPAFPDIIQEGGQRRGIADVHAAVPGGHRHRLRHPVPLPVADRVSELFRSGVDGGLILLDGGAARVAQPVSVQVAQQGP